MNLLRCGDECRASRAAARRERLVEVARKLFADHGFHGTGVAQLAAVSGIKVGQIYRDFTDKEAIVAAIVESDLATFLHEADLNAAIEARNAPAIREWIHMFARCEGASRSRALMPEIIAEASRNARIASVAHAITHRVKTALRTAICALAPHPHQQDARDNLADLILTIGAGLMHRRIAEPDFDEDAARIRLLRLVDRSIDELLASPLSVHQKDYCSNVIYG